MAQFKAGISGNPNGRPKGKTAGAKIRAAIEKQSIQIIEAVIAAALNGDIAAAKLLIDRILPALKPQSLPVTLPIGDSLPDTGNNVLNAILNGSIPPDIGAALVGALANQGKLIEVHDIQTRLEALEALKK